MPKIIELLQTTDWAQTTLGPRENWPVELQVSVATCLENPYAMCICWGTDRSMIYNDAYVEILGKKHPFAFGKPFRDVWGEASELIEPQFQKVWNGGGSVQMEDIQLTIN